MSIIAKDVYKTRLVGYGIPLNLVKTPDGILHIDIRDVPNCIWALDGDKFYCTHNEIEIITVASDRMGFEGPYEVESKCYACMECDEILDGNPEEDNAEEDR